MVLFLWTETTLALVAVYTVYGIIYRLFLSPIAHIPGPRLAALTSWYEFYFDVIQPGQYVWHIQELHKKYGMFILPFTFGPYS